MAKSIGGITYKTINGKRYAYYQWMEDGKQRSRHLKDAKKCRDTEFRYGTIVSRNVIYRGASQVIDGINYLNVEEYLKSF